jgi:hypothetical protein
LAATFFGAAFLAAGFLAATFFGAAFLAAGFLAATFFGAAFLAAGLAAAFFGAAFFAAAGFLTFFSSAIVNLHWIFEERTTNNPPTTARIIQQHRRTGIDEFMRFHSPSLCLRQAREKLERRRLVPARSQSAAVVRSSYLARIEGNAMADSDGGPEQGFNNPVVSRTSRVLLHAPSITLPY